ncbi:MAG TPA: DUF1801 domain-containing protein [Cytophagaceae bacterium]|jgi:uncharacterized protein YdeI (YjbR/CyaY-like superfamily)|nr:DUF1801 domain-containing protein [Cytophagaceae bacterium]
MGKIKQIDAYIDKSAPFAQPILNHFRELVHKACPQVEEKMKWGFPHFDYKGMCCSMAGFKEHCALNFWKASIMKDPKKLLTISRSEAEGMGHFGRITSLKELPADKVLIAYIKEAVRLNEEGIALPPKQKPTEKEKQNIAIPPALVASLKKNKKAAEQFENFNYSNKKEYAEWIGEAKTDDTRNKRLEIALEWIAEGKSRNWKYAKK